jgi:hypothetical protein
MHVNLESQIIQTSLLPFICFLAVSCLIKCLVFSPDRSKFRILYLEIKLASNKIQSFYQFHFVIYKY